MHKCFFVKRILIILQVFFLMISIIFVSQKGVISVLVSENKLDNISNYGIIASRLSNSVTKVGHSSNETLLNDGKIDKWNIINELGQLDFDNDSYYVGIDNTRINLSVFDYYHVVEDMDTVILLRMC